MRRFDQKRPRGRGAQAARLPARALIGALVGVIAATACSEIHLSAFNLEIAPVSATPGDAVIASFRVNVVPTQSHTIIVMIDGVEHTRVTSDEPPPVPVIIALGDAAELIDQYGAGTHAAHIEVQAHEANEVARSASALFELEESSP